MWRFPARGKLGKVALICSKYAEFRLGYSEEILARRSLSLSLRSSFALFVLRLYIFYIEYRRNPGMQGGE